MSSARPEAALRTFIATGFGSGRSPFAPGTAGSAVAVGLFWLTTLPGAAWLPPLAFALTLAAGWWSAGPVAERLGKKDPGMIVIDEFAGQFLALLALPPSWPVLAAGFVLFACSISSNRRRRDGWNVSPGRPVSWPTIWWPVCTRT